VSTPADLRSGNLRRVRVLASIALAMLTLAVGCGGGSDDDSPAERGSEPQAPVAEPAAGGHIHGLGLNPRDDALFIATHEGLFRAPEGSSRAKRVGKSWQDTMGFTVVGSDHFLGSGHPDLQSDLPAYLGLIESRDGGRTWKPKSLLGKADFHALEASGSIVYGSGSDFESREYRFLVSEDRGRTWERRDAPEPIVSVAVNPEDPRSILASGSSGLYSADDAGSRWRSLDGSPGLLAFAAADELYLIDADGGVYYRDGGQWAPRGEIGGAAAAFEAIRADMLLAALHDGSVKASTDGGRTWKVRARL
jgi:photosystem II stability/assembly factor-like uncharacterized protein